MSTAAKIAIIVSLVILALGFLGLLIYWLVVGRKLKEKIAFLNSRVKVLELEKEIQEVRAKQKANAEQIDANDEETAKLDQQIKDLDAARDEELKKVEGMSADDLLKAFKERGY